MLKKRLSEAPEFFIYTGTAEMAELWVDQENEHNERLKDSIEDCIEVFEQELKTRTSCLRKQDHDCHLSEEDGCDCAKCLCPSCSGRSPDSPSSYDQ